MLKITEYAQRLIDDLDQVDFIERVKTQQKNWIGRSTGAEVTFNTTQGDDLVVYTTRPDTLFGATYMVLSPEHPYINKWKDVLTNWDDVTAYVEAAARKSDFERTELVQGKDRREAGGREGHQPREREGDPHLHLRLRSGRPTAPAPSWPCPAHDDRDWAFAKKFGCDIIEVVQGGNIEKEAFTLKDDTGIMVNSDFLNGLTVKEAIPVMKKWLDREGHRPRQGELQAA